HERFTQMNLLLLKLSDKTLTEGERELLKELIRERQSDQSEEVTESERQSARLLPGVMAKEDIESRTEGDLHDVQLVGCKSNGPSEACEGGEG
ncbi:MAG: hypothetical protein LC742_10560, partial [Acidobacteria bacterium]|nr:hypothetical protein [Acidobacteriota bacterium]